MSLSLDIAVLYDFDSVEENSDKRPALHANATDQALAAAATTGDFEAFEELVRRYRNDVYALSYHYLRNREEAWDNAQEVFIRAFKAIRRFRGEASFKTWILRIAANRCKDLYKKRRIRTVPLDEVVTGSDRPASEPHPRKALEVSELGRAIEEAVGTLSEKHRTAFILREFEGLSYENMARVMGCSLGTVMSRLHHARKKLQSRLIGMGQWEDY